MKITSLVGAFAAVAILSQGARAHASEEEAADVPEAPAPSGVTWLPTNFKSMPCRPTIACNADIVPAGAVEIESGYTYIRSRDGSAGVHSTPVLLKLSVADWLQVQVGGNGAMVATGADASRHFDDVGAGLKARFIEQGKLVPAVSLSVHGFAPTKASVGYVRDYDLSSWLYVSKDVGPIHADLNFAGFALAVDQKPQVRELAALAVSADMPLHLTPMVELYRFGTAGDLAPADGGFLFGIGYSPAPWMVFDVAGDVSFYPETRGFTGQVGMTIVPADLWESSRERRERLAASRRTPIRTAVSGGRP